MKRIITTLSFAVACVTLATAQSRVRATDIISDMIASVLNLIFLLLIISITGCADKSYPEDMTKAERKEYYRKFNESKTEEEWEAIRAERKLKEKEVSKGNNQNKESISFSIKNNSILSKKLRVVDNILNFKPLEKRYVGFKLNTKVYLIQSSQEDKYLFTVTEKDEGKEFTISK